jgi:glucuronoarabinoxylan endo-1,4-beta-xylanase
VIVTVSCGLTESRLVTIHWESERQVIDGFGASSSNFVAPLSEDAMDFFYTTRGIGLTLLRTRAIASVGHCEEDKDRGGVCLASERASQLTGELQMAQMCVARGARVWSAFWSAPAAMKSNGQYMAGGAMIGTQANYLSLAAIQASYVTLMRSNGVPIYALSPQNEPDMSKPYPSATWTPRQIHDFIPFLHTALQTAGVGDTKIMIAEDSTWGGFDHARAAMDDAEVARQVGILAAHNYDQRNPLRPPTLPNLTTQHVWQTEVSSFEAYDGGLANALTWAERVHHFLANARVNAFHYWYLSAAPNDRTDNEGLTDHTGTVALRAYAIGHWSKFVRPGWHEVGVSNATSALVTAFQSSDREESVIVAVNRQAFPVSAEIGVARGMRGAVTPWITSDHQSLSRLTAIAVQDEAFSYELPAQSIVTFVGRAAQN